MSRQTLHQIRERIELFEEPEPLSPTPEPPECGFVAILDRMTPAERVSASRNGGFTRHERAIWAAQFPGEVPLINGEYEWLAVDLADLD